MGRGGARISRRLLLRYFSLDGVVWEGGKEGGGARSGEGRGTNQQEPTVALFFSRKIRLFIVPVDTARRERGREKAHFCAGNTSSIA